MPIQRLLIRVAETDATFSREGPLWVGKCLICNGPIAFDARTGEGATLEHIRARSRGGTDDLLNLGIAHASCNAEKGRRWDKKRRPLTEYETLVQRFLAARQQRWRDASTMT
jgi:5-methylcytosine-specific restriction endonuclease McrA